ncbi:MAG: hypothetical protein JOZ99_09635 [Actinobacteria bacterium]|nr:hypothetical protein [Actinomycetota bacterium]
MSSLWTPYGEREPQPGAPDDTAGSPVGGTAAPAAGPAGTEMSDAEMREAMARLAATPVRDIIANHAIGLWELAVLHLGLGGAAEVDLEEAALAIDAMGALVDGLGDRLGEHAQPLREALSQLRVAYVQIKEAAQPPSSSPG